MVLKEPILIVACCQVIPARLSLKLDQVQFPPVCTSLKCLASCWVSFIAVSISNTKVLCFVIKSCFSTRFLYR